MLIQAGVSDEFRRVAAAKAEVAALGRSLEQVRIVPAIGATEREARKLDRELRALVSRARR